MNKLVLIATIAVASLSTLSFTTFAKGQGDANLGKEKSAVCAACHSADGNSLIPLYPKLAGQHQNYLMKQLTEFRLATKTNNTKGRVDPVMAGMVANLTDDDIANLTAYFSTQSMTSMSTTADVIPVAQQLYRAGDASRGIPACIACHGPKGNGTELSGFPKISGQHPEYIVKQLEAFRAGTRKNDLNGMMQTTVKQLTDDEIKQLSKYISALH